MTRRRVRPAEISDPRSHDRPSAFEIHSLRMDMLMAFRRGWAHSAGEIFSWVRDQWRDVNERRLWRHLAYLRERGWVEHVADSAPRRHVDATYQVTLAGRRVRERALLVGELGGLGVTMLRPFWRYYGGKWLRALRYPVPSHAVIVEPFAGAAGYALRYPDRDVILIEKYHAIAEIWRWLVGASVDQVMAVPLVDSTEDLPAWVPDGARYLIGFCLQDTAKRPCRNLSAGMRRSRDAGEDRGWSEMMRARVAGQVDRIRHWRIIEGDYSQAPDVRATWFVDPPYVRTGIHYKHGSRDLDYARLADWCRRRDGQVLVCEEGAADWLPFRHLYDTVTKSNYQSGARELLWTSDDETPPPAAHSVNLDERATRGTP